MRSPQLIVGGGIAADVFVPVTPGPMMTVLKAGKARKAIPDRAHRDGHCLQPEEPLRQRLCRRAARKPGAMPWYEILQQPGIRFGRTDPATDPQGRNIIFTLQLAERYYKQPGLGANDPRRHDQRAQIFAESTVEARLQSGELDARVGLQNATRPLRSAVRLASRRDQPRQRIDARCLPKRVARSQRQDLPSASARLLRRSRSRRRRIRRKPSNSCNGSPAPRVARFYAKYSYDQPTGAVALT